jgi:hypothetical protein
VGALGQLENADQGKTGDEIGLHALAFHYDRSKHVVMNQEYKKKR